MKIQTTRIRAVITREFEIRTDWPVLLWSNSTSGKKIRITRGAVTYTQQSDGTWATSRYDTRLYGHVLRKDGRVTLGNEVGHSLHYGDEYPAWLSAMINALRPATQLDLAEFTAEVNE